MRNLKVGEMFHLDEFRCKVCNDISYGYYLECSPNNDSMFKKFSLNKLELQQSILGYKDSRNGTFPYCNTLDDLANYVDGIAEVIQNKKYPPGTNPDGTPDYIGKFKVDLTPKGSIVERYATPKESYKIDVSPEAIKKDGRLRTFLLIS